MGIFGVGGHGGGGFTLPQKLFPEGGGGGAKFLLGVVFLLIFVKFLFSKNLDGGGAPQAFWILKNKKNFFFFSNVKDFFFFPQIFPGPPKNFLGEFFFFPKTRGLFLGFCFFGKGCRGFLCILKTWLGGGAGGGGFC